MSFEELLKAEPWRAGHGQPQHALSAGWVGDERVPCTGDIEWEGDTKFWGCKKCGYIGSATYTTHNTVQFPSAFLSRSFLFFLQRRAAQGITNEQAYLQMMHIAGVALRNAAALPPEQLPSYLQQILTP